MLDIANIYNKEEFCHPLCLLRIIGLKRNCTISVTLITVSDKSSITYNVKNDYYNALVMLKRGKNVIEIRYESQLLKREVFFKPHTHQKVVELIYITCQDTDQFQCLLDGEASSERAVEKIQTATLLMQTFIAETISHEKLGRKTFKMELLESGYPKVSIFQIPYTLAEANNLTEMELWDAIATMILSSPLADRKCKYLAIYCGTRYSPSLDLDSSSERDILASTAGHVSLGGGDLALVGSGAMYSWAPSIDQALDAMQNKTKINQEQLMDFSGGRHTWGHAYGTHLGSILHELAHTFNIGHNEHGIMSRGFEDFHLFFIGKEIYNDYMFSSKVSKMNESKKLGKKSICFTEDFVSNKDICRISLGITLPESYGVKVIEDSFYSHLEVIRPGTASFCGSCDIGLFGGQFKPASAQPRRIPTVLKTRAFWERANVLLLAYHPWFTGISSEEGPTLKGSVIKSEEGIRLIELRDAHAVTFFHWEFTEVDPPTVFHIPWAKVPYWPPCPYIELIAIDDASRLLRISSMNKPL